MKNIVLSRASRFPAEPARCRNDLHRGASRGGKQRDMALSPTFFRVSPPQLRCLSCPSDRYVTSARITTRRQRRRRRRRRRREQRSGDAMHPLDVARAYRLGDETRREDTTRRKSNGRGREGGRNLRSSSVTAHTGASLSSARKPRTRVMAHVGEPVHAAEI